ncbi:exodeoxyribonuclease VII large subunit [Pseudomonas aeruginosa]|nr:exodeoxyribonuclease VII large subunit [Pseudomonas aeruginosa]MDF6001923.1 exodeoxyribonuclease VII large subunit [Pseudomonas aeruginosa]
MSLEAALAKHGLEAIAILATGTAWNDLAAAAQSLPVFSHCRRVETNFMEPEQFLSDLAKVCQDPAIQVLVIARGGGDSLEVIGDSREVACALLACGRPFYTALGHDDNVMLLDKHADRSFSTPSILGQALMETARDITQRQELQESLGKFAQENASLKNNCSRRTPAWSRTWPRSRRPFMRRTAKKESSRKSLYQRPPLKCAGTSYGRLRFWWSLPSAVARRDSQRYGASGS